MLPEIGDNFQACALSTDGLHVVVVSRFYNQHIRLLACAWTNLLPAFRRTVNCDEICIGMRPLQNRSDRYTCKFSHSSKYIWTASSTGYAFVVRPNLDVQCVLVGQNGLLALSDNALANERSIDFDPTSARHLIALGTISGTVYVCDYILCCLRQRVVVPQSSADSQAVSIQCVRYSKMGDVLAVAVSTSVIHILQPESATWLYCIDAHATELGWTLPLAPSPNNSSPVVVQMAFSHADDILVVTTTNGQVSLWQLPVDLSLKHLCRLTLKQCSTLQDIVKLPLPPSLHKYLQAPHYKERHPPDDYDDDDSDTLTMITLSLY